MALLKITEPGKAVDPHQRKLAVGIDLGTTNSLVASVFDSGVETIPDAGGNHLVPSVVHYAADGRLLVGTSALELAAADSQNTVVSVKRLMGRGQEDVKTLGTHMPYSFVAGSSNMPLIRTRLRDVSPVEVSAEILRALIQRATASLGGDIEGAVITVPAYFDDAQRQATRDAAQLAGIHVLRLLNEPTAAAVAYGMDQGAEGQIVVFDLGGGTFDVSILRLNKGVFEVLATGGDAALGGDDIDHEIARWLLQQANNGGQIEQDLIRGMLLYARSLKEQLTVEQRVPVRCRLGQQEWRGELDRDTLNRLMDPLIDRAMAACRRCLRDSGVALGSIANVILVGGATRIPRVREKVAAFFGREPLADIDPDRVVAIGAAIQANVLIGNKPDEEMLLLDVLPLSLGIETMGQLVEKLIHRNSPIPVAKAQEFTTYKDGQTAMLIHVLQGERELVSDCRSLARFELRGIPPMVAGAAHVRVTFQVDADGLLSVSARETATGVAASVEVKPSYGLRESEIVSMIRDSFEHATEDQRARALREAQVEAERMISSVRAALAADGMSLLEADERHQLEQAVARLDAMRAGDDPELVTRETELLGKASEEFAARRMDASVRKALAGHVIDEFEAGVN